MSEPSLPPTRSGRERSPSSSGELRRGPLSSRASVPPSDPRSSRGSFDAIDAQLERPARLQMLVALVLGLVLVAIPLYLWRRPRAEALTVASEAFDAGLVPTIVGTPAEEEEDKLVLGEPKLLSCHNPGPKKTPREKCDRIAPLEEAFAKAIEDSASCVPMDAGGETIIFVADVSFPRKRITITTPKEGRTLKSPRIAAACQRAVKAKLSKLPLESMEHEHARYRLSITATYPAPSEE